MDVLEGCPVCGWNKFLFVKSKDKIKEVRGALKASEIASSVLIAGYQTDLDQDGLAQRVSATLKKHLNEVFDWDSQRYKLLPKA